jgi:hypothetical protein
MAVPKKTSKFNSTSTEISLNQGPNYFTHTIENKKPLLVKKSAYPLVLWRTDIQNIFRRMLLLLRIA